MTEWIQPYAPIAGAQEIDFAQWLRDGIDRTSEPRQITLAGVGVQSPGDWTMYVLRLTYLESPDLTDQPALITKVSLQAGTDKGRGDLLGLERSTISTGSTMQTMASLYRGVAFHIAAGAMDLTIGWLPGVRTVDDRILAWVAPGRPSRTWLEGTGVTSATTVALSAAGRLRIPVFARRVTIGYSNPGTSPAVQPFVSFWAGPVFVGVRYITPPAPFRTTTETYVIPQRATHMSMGDDGAAAVGQTMDYQYEIES